MLSINNLTKTYPGGTRALRGVSLQIPQGMFGLLGPNGAGKSTLMKILATLLEPDEGTAQLDGLNLVEQKDETRKILGYLPQEFGVYPKMPAIDLLEHLAVMKGITDSALPRIRAIISEHRSFFREHRIYRATEEKG